MPTATRQNQVKVLDGTVPKHSPGTLDTLALRVGVFLLNQFNERIRKKLQRC